MPENEDNLEGGNLSAVQSISTKLLEVTRLAEKLDSKLCEAGARTQPLDPNSDMDEGNAVILGETAKELNTRLNGKKLEDDRNKIEVNMIKTHGPN